MKIIKKYQEGNPIEGQDVWEERERKRLQQLRNGPGLTPVYPEFDLLLGARGLINGAVKEGIKQVPRAAKYIYNAAKKLPYSKTAHNFMTGMIGGLTVDNLNKQLFGKSWGESVSEPVGYVVRKAGWNPDDTQWGRMLANIGTTAAEFTNPGYLLSPAGAKQIGETAYKGLQKLKPTFGYIRGGNTVGTKLYSGIDPAIMGGKSEPPVKMVRLYRATGTNGQFEASPDGTVEFAGQWFTTNTKKPQMYASATVKRAKRSGIENPIELQYIDIPETELAQYKAANILKNRTDVEYEPLEDYLIPLDYPRQRVPLVGYTGNYLQDVRMELPVLNQSAQDAAIARDEYGWGRLDMAQNWQPSKYNPSQQQILLGSKKAASRVIGDAAYLERLEKFTRNRELAKKTQQAQLDAMDYTTLGNDLSANAVDNGVYALFRGTYPQPDNLTVVFGTPGYRKLMNTPDYLAMARRQIPSNISFSSYYFERYPGEHWFKRGTHEVLHSGKMTPMFEAIEKHNANLANKVRQRVMYNYELSPWEIEVPENSAFVGPDVINYLTRPDELRVRAHKVFRINQTTGKPWVDILNDPKYIKDPDIKQLKDLYDKAGFDDGSNAVIDFLNEYLKKGGKLKSK